MPSSICEGIILRRHNFGEADRVLSVYTDRYGKISVVARGVRKITSRRAGNIEILNRVKLHLFKAKSYTLTEAESIESFPKIKSNLTLSTYAFHVIEMIDKLTNEDEKSLQVYILLKNTLTLLEQNPRQIFLRAFEVKLLSLMGFWSVSQVGEIDESIRDVLNILEKSSWTEIDNLDITAQQAQLLEQILRNYNEKVLERPLKSIQVLKQIKSVKPHNLTKTK